jgi:ABC-type sugar transport system ATPase subunit
MSISDRLLVLNDGVIQQIGSPVDIYERPANEFIAVKSRSHKVLNLVMRF